MRRNFSTLMFPALFLIGMTAFSPAKAKQDAGKEAAEAAEKLEARVQELEKKVASQQEELNRLTRFADGVLVGVGRLAGAADAAREHGFESAGPNPAARTDLIDGMKTLDEVVRASFEKPKDAAAPAAGEGGKGGGEKKEGEPPAPEKSDQDRKPAQPEKKEGGGR
jgi:hypothetical protein